MTQLTIQDVTNLYLYKQKSVSKNRLDDSLITRVSAKEEIDKKEFMREIGRFVTANDFEIVRYFFMAKDSLINLSSQARILANLKPGKYSKVQILEMLGYTQNGANIKFAGEIQALGFYDDNKGDLLERAYLWNTTGFKIRDNVEGQAGKDLYFVIEQSGKRYIENFGIEPLNKKEDFDFEGGFWSNLVNLGLESIIDPSGIGKTIGIDFIGKVDTYTLDEAKFKEEANKKSNWSLINAAKVYDGLDQIIKKLWDSGSIKHLYQDEKSGQFKPIIYGTNEGDSHINGTKITRKIAGKQVTIDIANQKIDKGILSGITSSMLGNMLLGGISNDDLGTPLPNKQDIIDSLTKIDNRLASYVKNGVVYVMGNGDDIVTGTEYEDIFHGGQGEDIYHAGEGDLIEDSDGKGKIYLIRANNLPKADPEREDNEDNLKEKEEIKKGLLIGAILESYTPSNKSATFAYSSNYIDEASRAYTNYRYEVKGLKLPVVKKLKSPLVDFTADLLTIIPIDEEGNPLTKKGITIKNFRNGDLGIGLMDLNSYFYLLGGDTVGYDENSPGFYTPRNGGGSRNNSSDTGSNNEWGGNGHGNNRSNASDLNQPDNDDKNGNTNTPNNQGRNYDVYDPLALDLDGDGLETISMNGHKGALFDHEGIGIRTATGWLAADDGFLVLDRNQDGMINDISELFSNKNKLSDGSISSHGFVALSDLDVNKDKLIDQNDTLFSKLQVWRDLNRNGFSEPEELFSLEALNIKSLHTAYEERNDVLFGDNILTQLGKYEKTDGSFSQMGDINFSFNPFYSRFTEALNLTEHQKRAINLAGTGRVRDLREAATLSVELETLLQKYTVASDYKEQRSLLPVILDKWATTDLQYKPYEKELLKTVESTDSSAAVVRVTPTQLNNIRNGKNDPVVMQNFEKTKARISTLNSLYGLNINQLYYTTDEDIRYITDKVNNMYQTTVDLAYRSLLLQTRLKKYLYSINVKQVGGKWTNDYSRTKALFNATFYKSPENALYDLSEYLSFFEHHLKWKEGLLLLSYYIDYAKEQGFYENWVTSSNVTITHLKSAGILFAESINLKANQENNILLGNKNDNQLVGDLGDDLLIGGLGNDTLKGGYGSDTYIFSKGHGQDVIYEDSDTQHREHDIDILEFTDVNYAEVKFRREDNDLVIFGYHDNDSVKMKYFYSHEDYQFDRLVFADRSLSRDELRERGMALFGTAGNDNIIDWSYNSVINADIGDDIIEAGKGDDTLIGGAGNDTLKGGYGSDTYIFSKGHGQDVIYEDSDTQHREHDIDILEFTDVNYAEVKFRREDNDLVIFGYHDNDSVKIKYFYSHEDYRFDQLVFSDRTLSRSELIKEGIHLYGTDSDDEINDYSDWSSTLQGGTGNDTLKGGYGADTYIFSKGHGQDVIYEDSDTQHREHDIDILEFTDVNYAEVKLRREDNDLVIFGYHDNDSVKIKYFYSHEDYQFDRLVFLDRSLSRDELREQGMALFGTAGNDNIIDWSYNSVINADIGDDIIEAGKGDDTLIGGAGNDILKGSYGADTYIFSKGHGQDVIYEDSDSVNRTRDIDTIQFTDIDHISELWFSREQNHLIIKSLLSEDSVTIQNWYSHQDYKVENIRLSDNRTLVIPEVERLVDAMASFSQQNGGNISLIPQGSIRHYIDSIITNLS